MNAFTLSAHEIKGFYQNKGLTPLRLAEILSQRVEEVEPKVKAFVKRPDKDKLDFSSGRTSGDSTKRPLWGIPVAIKDNLCVRGEETTCASGILKGYYAPYEATVISRLRQAGAVLWGRTNMDEFAFGSSCENSCYGPTCNPWDVSRVPGGSSGGSAAAVAAREVPMALGTDTGGSIRQPAAFCGVVGLKPTYGRVSRYGLVAFASSLDQIGPLTRSVKDAAILLGVIAGHDPKDSTSVDAPVPDYLKDLGEEAKGLKVGIPREYFVKGLDPQVREALEEAIRVLTAQGVEFIKVSLPHTDFAVAVYYILATAEASSNLARFDGVQYGLRVPSDNLITMYEKTRGEGFGPEAKRRILLGTYVLSRGYYEAYYLRAQRVRAKIKEDFDRVFQDCDCLITPTTPTAAFKLGEKLDDPLAMYLSDIYTIPANLAGLPALSLPCGFSREGLPIGMQIVAGAFEEAKMLRLAFTYEQATEWHRRFPSL